jgi:hypothetical protein
LKKRQTKFIVKLASKGILSYNAIKGSRCSSFCN